MTDRVQFRTDPEKIAFFEREGINANALARELFQAEFRRRRAAARAERLRSMNISLGGSSAPLIRHDRDTR